MKPLFYPLVLFCLLSCNSPKTNSISNHDNDKALINKTIEEWDKAWATKNVESAIKYYANDTDWTNAFGDRVQNKAELKELLDFIFGLDFVMAGENDYGENEITFLNDSIATARSLNIRKNQEWPDGTKMEDRYVNHLRVFQKINGEWLIVDHMISQAWPKRQANDSVQVEE
jgi:hypothetical protein